MAETFLTPVIKRLIELLADEVNSQKGVYKEVKSLKDELEIIQPFLKDAEAKSEKGEVSDAAKVWLKQIREEADHIEDVIDEYIHHITQRRHGDRHRGFASSLRQAGHLIKALKPRHDIASEVRDIKESLREIKERGQSYGLRPFEKGSSSGATNVEVHVVPRLGSLFIEEDELVGIDLASTELLGNLVEGPSSRSVISLVGEGGIGKTTLAKKVYKDAVEKGNFDCHVWITVSRPYNMEKILKIMKSKICPTTDQPREELGNFEELIDRLRQYLQTKRYIVVFDDVWQTDFWDVVKYALPSNDRGSRIIVTTRNTMVVDSFKETPFDIVQELKTWSPDLAWKLFCKTAFRYDFEGKCPQELEELSRKIVTKCQGLPLVIAAVGGLLSKKEKIKLEWQNVLDNINYEFEKNPQLTSVSKVLSFSYQDLPYHLKPCLLYFGIFPQDYSIVEDRLYTLWIAEGFIESRRDKTLEQVAKEYLNELIHRNLVSLEIGTYGIKRVCRVHDLIHDIILARFDELLFCQILNQKKLKYKEKSHRLSISGSTKDVLKIVGDFRVRSLLLFDMDELTNSFVVSLFESFKLLKVLDFEDAPLCSLPSEVGNLFHLKYLNLRGTAVKMLPKSIGKLYNLQALNISQTLIRELPIEINRLRSLRYLLAYWYDDENKDFSFDAFCGVRLRDGFGCLEELQTLRFVEACVSSVGFVKELEKLQKLTTLGIGKLTAEMGRALGASIEKMHHLEKLYLSSINDDENLDLSISSPPRLLRYLSLKCRLTEFPAWISKLENLSGLSLRFSRLTCDPLKGLKSLPNLSFFSLHKAYDGEELHFEEGGFQKLKQLLIRDLEGLKAVKIDQGALPLLETLKLGPCPLMKETPTGMEHLTNLKSLKIRKMPREFMVGLQPHGGSHFWKIKHVPSVIFVYKGNSHHIGSSDLLQRLQE